MHIVKIQHNEFSQTECTCVSSAQPKKQKVTSLPEAPLAPFHHCPIKGCPLSWPLTVIDYIRLFFHFLYLESCVLCYFYGWLLLLSILGTVAHVVAWGYRHWVLSCLVLRRVEIPTFIYPFTIDRCLGRCQFWLITYSAVMNILTHLTYRVCSPHPHNSRSLNPFQHPLFQSII